MGIEANELQKKLIHYCAMRNHYVVPIKNRPQGRRRNTVKKGISDLMGTTNEGQCLCIEVKVEDEQSEDQKEFEHNITSRDGIYIIARSVDDLIKAGLWVK